MAKFLHVELFAGCGGLDLGLRSCGFHTLFANEISPMAGQSYAFNFLGEDLEKAPLDLDSGSKVFWLESAYSRDEMAKRLRENPFAGGEKPFSEFPASFKELDGSLIIGDIWKLIDRFKASHALLDEIQKQGGVDLLSGGPPCQGFSMAGLRIKGDAKNRLPFAFAQAAEILKPKIVLLENVSGIMRPFTENGVKYWAHLEVCKAFSLLGYVPLALHVNAKFCGVAQNRPRFVMLAARRDVLNEVWPRLNETERKLFFSSLRFADAAKSGARLEPGMLTVRDLNKGKADLKWFTRSFLAPLSGFDGRLYTVKDAIGDLCESDPVEPSGYVKMINGIFNPFLKYHSPVILNDHKKESSPPVKERFSVYQQLSGLSAAAQSECRAVMRGNSNEISLSAWNEIKEKGFVGAPEFKKKDSGCL